MSGTAEQHLESAVESGPRGGKTGAERAVGTGDEFSYQRPAHLLWSDGSCLLRPYSVPSHSCLFYLVLDIVLWHYISYTLQIIRLG